MIPTGSHDSKVPNSLAKSGTSRNPNEFKSGGFEGVPPLLERGTGTHDIIFLSTPLQRPVRFKADLKTLTLGDLVGKAVAEKGIPKRFWREGRIELGGHEISREHWHRVRVKPDNPVFMHLLPAGGGNGDSAKNILGAVAAVFLVVATAGIAAGGIGIGSFAIQGGSLAAKLIAGGVGPASYTLKGFRK